MTDWVERKREIKYDTKVLDMITGITERELW